MKLSVLDYGLVDAGQTHRQALAGTVALAQLADQLGYERFWVAEHHQVPALGIASPELVMMHLLDQTARIQIGSGGIMLPHYAAYKVAEWHQTLTALHPGRVNLGLGNNPGTAAVRALMGTGELRRAHYQQQVRDLVSYVQAPEAVTLAAHPDSAPSSLWLLSASEATAQLAGELGLGYVYGLFLAPDDQPRRAARQALTRYRQAAQAAGHHPQAMLAVFVALGETERAAQDLLSALDVWQLGKQDYAEFATFPTPEQARTYARTSADEAQIARNRQKLVAGTPPAVKAQLDQLAQELELDELMVIPLVPGLAQRQACLTALARLYSFDHN